PRPTHTLFPYTTLFRSTTITAKAGPNALAVLAIAEEGCLLNAPDVYMDKIAIGPGYEPGLVSLTNSPGDNVRALAKAKGVDPHEDRKSTRLNSSHVAIS